MTHKLSLFRSLRMASRGWSFEPICIWLRFRTQSCQFDGQNARGRRQERHRATYDWAKDQEELRKVKGQVNALAVKKRKRVRQRLAGEAGSLNGTRQTSIIMRMISDLKIYRSANALVCCELMKRIRGLAGPRQRVSEK